MNSTDLRKRRLYNDQLSLPDDIISSPGPFLDETLPDQVGVEESVVTKLAFHSILDVRFETISAQVKN